MLRGSSTTTTRIDRGVAERLLPRDSAEHQSRGTFRVRSAGGELGRFSIAVGDCFHTLVHRPTWQLIGLSALLYAAIVTLFGTVYVVAPKACGLPTAEPLRAFFFAVRTTSTLGYDGRNDPGMRACLYGVVAVSANCFCALLLDALVAGVVFARVSREYRAAYSVIFSQRAVLRRVDAELQHDGNGGSSSSSSSSSALDFAFRVVDLREHQLIEAHVRCYALQRRGVSGRGGVGECDDEGFVDVELQPMRLRSPDDGFGSTLLLALPSTVVHRIDERSPLMPPRRAQRGGDAETGDAAAAASVSGSASSIELGAVPRARPPPTPAEVRAWLETSQTEVICVVEGIAPSTSGTVQSRHSYAAEDVAPDSDFLKCVRMGTSGGASLLVDAARFHLVEAVLY